MKLRSRNSQLRYSPEGTPDASIWSKISTFLYGSVLVGLVGLVALYMADRWMNFEARGQVRSQIYPVSAERQGRILEIMVEEGQPVEAQTPLARIQPGRVCDQPTDSPQMEVAGQLQIDSMKQRNLRERINQLQQRREQLQQKQALEIPNIDQKIEDVDKQLAEAQQEYRVLQTQISVRQQQLQNLTERPTRDEHCQPFQVHSPRQGTITNLYHYPGEVVQAGTPILALRPGSSETVVWAYMEENRFEDVHVGKIVEVVLPNGKTTKGKIQNISSSEQPFAQPKWQNYQPANTELLVKIKALNDSIQQLWQPFERMDVQVRGDK